MAGGILNVAPVQENVRSLGEKKTKKKREEEGDIQPDYMPNSGVLHVSAVYIGGVARLREAERGSRVSQINSGLCCT